MKKVKAVLLSVGVTVIAGAALFALTALILGKTGNLPRSLLPVLTTVEGCFAVFLGGLAGSMYAREKGLLFGVIAGAVCAAVIVPVSLLAFQSPFTISSAGKLAALLLSGSIGGILGVNRKSKVKF